MPRSGDGPAGAVVVEFEAADPAGNTDHDKTENHNIQPARNPG
ncbi:hypothetical protein [Candidatus Poriferisodalis sp.]